MRTQIAAITVSALALVTSNSVIAQPSHHAHDHKHNQEQANEQKYTCPMHPEVVTDHPGNCPKCGMKLVPLKQGERQTPINREQASNSDNSRAGAQHSTSNVEGIDLHRLRHAHEHADRHPSSHGSGAAAMEMQSSIDLAEPMSREGSGTSWLPDSSPMYGRMFMFGEDMLMLHGAIFRR